MDKNLFQDRREQKRMDSNERRQFLRPSMRLRWLGILAAGALAAIVSAIVYFY